MDVARQTRTEEGKMEYTTLNPWQEISEHGIVYTMGSLYDRFQQLSDPRKAKGKQYSLLTLLVIIFLAKMVGKDKPLDIAAWAQNHAEELVALLGLKRKQMPSHHTIRRVYHTIISIEEFEALLEEYHQQQNEGDGEVLALDGKVLRGTRVGGERCGEMVLSVYDGQSQQVKAQCQIESKENEIVAAHELLERVEIAGKIVTADAMHTQRDWCQQIVDAQGDYLLPVKENQERLYQDIARLFAPDQPKPGFGKLTTDFQSTKQVSYGHGRLEVRILQASELLNDHCNWPGLSQVYHLERQFYWLRQSQVYKSSVEVELGITSLARQRAQAAKVLKVRRLHWQIETGLHYRRDVTFHEDATRMTLGNAGQVLAIIHNLVIGLFKRAGFAYAPAARRFFDGHLIDAFYLLLHPFPLS
jgi:predicted transposase YbfD/YdcC